MRLYRKKNRHNNLSAVWWCEFRLTAGPNKGKKVRRSTGERDRRRAEVRAGGIRAELEATAARQPTPPPRRGPSVVELAGYDLARAEAKGVGERQYRSIKDCWKHVCRGLGVETPAVDLTYDHVEDYIRARRKAGARGQSIRKETQALARGLKIAKRKKELAEVIEMPEISSDPPDMQKRGKLHPLPVLRKFFAGLDAEAAKEPRMRLARPQAETIFYTGLRLEEVQKLSTSWIEPAPEDVQTVAGVAALLRVPSWAAKTREERVVGLTAETLARLQQLGEGKGADTPLLPGRHDKAYRRVCRAIDYPQNITNRDLRHCYATLSAQGTGDAAAAQAALGHRRLSTTQRYLTATLIRTAGATAAVERAMSAHPPAPTPQTRRVPTPQNNRVPKRKIKSGRQDSNLRPSAPKATATLQRHLSECAYCRALVAECMGLQDVAEGFAHPPAHPPLKLVGEDG